jgi:hypothetical protein
MGKTVPVKVLRSLAVWPVIGVLTLATTVSARQAENREADRADTPNTSNAVIARKARGTYEYGRLDSDVIRGHEDWIVTSHPDGTRTLQAFVDLRDGDHQTNVILRVDRSFRPLDAYASFWRSGVYGGAGRYRIDGTMLHAAVSGPSGQAAHSIAVPDRFSLRVHPVITEGWQVWPYDRSMDGPQKGVLYNVVTIGDPPVPGIGVLREHDIEYLGRESVTVPAGTFDTDHYKFYDGRYDIWLWGPDDILVRYANFLNGNEYRLISLSTDFQR